MKPDGGPAFPSRSANIVPINEIVHSGMSLRDYFAAAALQGICAHRAVTDEWAEENLARAAYHWADAMLAEREKS